MRGIALVIKSDRLAPLTQIGLTSVCQRFSSRHGNAVYFGFCRIGLAKLLGCAHAVIAFLEMFPDERGLQILHRLQAKCDARRPQIAAVDVVSGDPIDRIAVALCPFARDAQIGAVIYDGNIDHAFEAAILVVANIAARHRLELIGWFGGDEIYDACRCVAPIERALGAAQNFGLAEIEKFLLEKVVADERDVVQCHGNSWIGCDRDSLCADATDLDAVAAEVCLREVEVWYLLHEIGPACRLRGGQLFLAQCGNCDRYALDIGAAKFRRSDRDRFHTGAWRSGLGQLHRLYFHFAMDFRHDSDGTGGCMLSTEASPGKKPNQSSIGWQVAMNAVGMDASDGRWRVHQRNTGLLHVRIERCLEIAARNIKILRQGTRSQQNEAGGPH